MHSNPSNTEGCRPFPLIVPTAGKVLDDGTIIELIADPSDPVALALVKWDGQELEIGSQIMHRGNLYIPLLMPPTVRGALRLPSGCGPGGAMMQLFTRLMAVFEKLTSLTDYARRLVVTFVFASWIPDFLPVPVNLFLWASPDLTAGAQVLLLLSALCRQALAVSGADGHDLRALPEELPATLLLFRPAFTRRSLELLAATGWRGLRTCRKGRLVETIGAKAIVSDTPLSNDPALGPTLVVHVAACRRPLPPIEEKTLGALASEFLPDLLRFRLQRCQTVAQGGSVESTPAGPVSSLTGALQGCFSDEPELNEMVTRLVEVAENGHEMGRANPRVVLLEVLLARCHEKARGKIFVAEVALDVNARILANGGAELSDRLVGSLLKSLGLATCKLDRRGRGLALDKTTRQQIHRLAREHTVPLAEEPFSGCVECAEGQSVAK